MNNPIAQHSDASAIHSVKFLFEILTRCVFALICLYFISFVLRFGGHPAVTLLVAIVAGGVAVWVMTSWVTKYTNGGRTRLFIVFAYLARIVVGVFLYLTLDSNYFSGSGNYIDNNWEYYLTYNAAVKASNSLLVSGEWRWWEIFDIGETKNPAIHMWMGTFLSMSSSENAMDLAVFNSFHHVLAAIIVAAIALHNNYSVRASFLSAIVIAWLPWSFPASIMWRDEVGFGFIALALLLLAIARKIGYLGIPFLGLACWLAFIDRSEYVAVFLLMFFLSKLLPALRNAFDKHGIIVWIAVLGLTVTVGFVSASYFQTVVFVGQDDSIGESLSQRILTFPILLLRAILGPFPWFLSVGEYEDSIQYKIFDYAYHVLQFAVLIVLVRNWRICLLDNTNLLVLAFLGIWTLGVIAPGVHTAYLAVGLPFILPAIFERQIVFHRYLYVALTFFVSANVLFVLSGLSGSGLSQVITGY